MKATLRTLLQTSHVAGLGILIGLSAAIIANGFVAGITWMNDTLLISPRSRMMANNELLLIVATVLVPALGGLAVGIIKHFIDDKRFQGPPDVIAAVQTRQQMLATRPALLSGVASLLSLGSGASVGQYGPLVHLGGVLGSLWSKLFRMDISMGNIAIACGVAAAISTIFHAPIAGILFAQEVILRHFSLRALAPIAVASIASYVAANTILPQVPLLQIESAEILHFWEFGFFLLLGSASALVAVAYMQSILWVSRFARTMPLPAITRPAFAGAMLGVVALWVPEILGNGGESLRFALIGDAFSRWELLLLLVLKILATAWCLGMGFAGGVFSPALLIGSLFGALFGSLVAMLGGSSSAVVVYAVCGMVAVTAPVIGAPMTTVVIVFEMTGHYPLTIAALSSVALASLTTSRLFGRSLFDRQLHERGIDLSGGRSKALLCAHTIKPLVTKDCLQLHKDTRVSEAIAAISQAQAADAYLVDHERHYLGTVHLHTLVNSPPDHPASRYCSKDDLTMYEDMLLWESMNALREFVGESVPVLDRQHRLVGAVVESDVIRAYLDILKDMRREEYAPN
ncbi:chloride channel protein [Vreelandella aquamarina]